MRHIDSYKSAEIYVHDMGLLDYAWGGEASLNDFIAYFYDRCSPIVSDEEFEELLVMYLEFCEENPEDYNIKGKMI